MTVPTHEDIERVILITADALRWDCSKPYQDLYPHGTWYRSTSQATFTPASHASMLTSMHPPRTGVIKFGEVLNHPNMLTQVDSAVSTSGITDISEYDPEKDWRGDAEFGFVPIGDIEQETVGFMWMREDEGERETLVNAVADHDFTFVHDWMIHSSEFAYEDTWSQAIRDEPNDPEALEKNIKSYLYCIGQSRNLHKLFFDMLREEGLYENTLFVIWGDHGQGLGHPPSRMVNHCNAPMESTARVPIGFCSPLFEETKVIEDTNARGVDIWPTLTTIMDEAGIGYKPMPHEVEGVDLTSFEGELYGYSIALSVARTGYGEAVSDNEHFYVEHDHRALFERIDVDGWDVGKKVDNDFLMSTLDQQRGLVRREPSTLVKRRDLDDEQLEAMGYL